MVTVVSPTGEITVLPPRPKKEKSKEEREVWETLFAANRARAIYMDQGNIVMAARMTCVRDKVWQILADHYGAQD